MNDAGIDYPDVDDDTESLPFLSLAVEGLVYQEDADADNPHSGNRPNAANDPLDPDATTPLPILGAADADASSPRPVSDISHATTTGPLPVPDALNRDAAESNCEITTSLPAPEAGCDDANGRVPPGWWTKIRAYIGF